MTKERLCCGDENHLGYADNSGAAKYLENLAVSKFFKKSNEEIVKNDIIDYCRASRITGLGLYDRMNAALAAIDRCGDNVDSVIEDFDNFRQMVFYYFG